MVITRKRADEVVRVEFPYADEILTARITGISVTAESNPTDPDTDTHLSFPTLDGATVLVLFGEGVPGTLYELKCIASFNDGRKLLRKITLKVRTS